MRTACDRAAPRARRLYQERCADRFSPGSQEGTSGHCRYRGDVPGFGSGSGPLADGSWHQRTAAEGSDLCSEGREARISLRSFVIIAPQIGDALARLSVITRRAAAGKHR